MMTDTPRFARTEILNRFKREIAYRYVDLEPYYNNENGLLGFKLNGNCVGLFIQRVLPSGYGVPNRFLLIDNEGNQISDGNIYETVSNVLEHCSPATSYPDFEFVGEPLATGDMASFAIGPETFIVEMLETNHDNEVPAYATQGKAFVTDIRGMDARNYMHIESMADAHSQRKLHRQPALDVAANGKVKAVKVDVLLQAATEEPQPVNICIFSDVRSFKRHVEEAALAMQAPRTLVSLKRLTPHERQAFIERRRRSRRENIKEKVKAIKPVFSTKAHGIRVAKVKTPAN